MRLHDDLPRLDHLVGVAGAQRDQAGHRPQLRQLLDRLVGRPVFADADRIVREDVDDRDLHDRAPGGSAGSAVVAEDQEARAEGADLDEGHAVHDRGHGMLADAEVEIAAAVAAGLEIARAFER